MKGAICGTIALACAAGAGWNIEAVRPITNPPIKQVNVDADSSTTASLLGQLRSSVTSWLWVRTDLYLHNGVMMRPITAAEVQSGVEVDKAAKDGHEKLHEDTVVTVVPPPERDFRGVLGDLEREVSAYKSMKGHSHNSPEDSLPLYRLMTWIDPQFIEGWTTGAIVMARDRGPQGTHKAMTFLTEALENNPGNVDLLNQVAYLQITRQKELGSAAKTLEQARQSGLVHRRLMSDSDRNAFENTYRWLSLCYRDLKQTDKMTQVLREGLKFFPDDGPMQRLLKDGGDGQWATKSIEAAAEGGE